MLLFFHAGAETGEKQSNPVLLQVKHIYFAFVTTFNIYDIVPFLTEVQHPQFSVITATFTPHHIQITKNVNRIRVYYSKTGL